MKLRLSNQLNMVGACLTIAQSPDYKPSWADQEPIDFGSDLAKVQSDHAALVGKVALASAAAGGATDAKAATESLLEDNAYLLARALANHYKKTGDLAHLAKVDVAKYELVRLRENELVAKATEIRNLGQAAQSEPNAAGRGVTAVRVAALDAAIENFKRMANSPRGQIVNRGALLKEAETDIAALIEQLHDLDDLVIQFGGTPAGDRFVEAWKRARIIVDLGGSHPVETPAPAPVPATVA